MGPSLKDVVCARVGFLWVAANASGISELVDVAIAAVFLCVSYKKRGCPEGEGAEPVARRLGRRRRPARGHVSFMLDNSPYVNLR